MSSIHVIPLISKLVSLYDITLIHNAGLFLPDAGHLQFSPLQGVGEG